MVILAGSGHLLYNLGINRRVFKQSRWPFSTVICVVIPSDRESVRVSRSLADYIWGIRAEERPAFPAVGLRFKKFPGLDNPVVEREPIAGVALEAGFEQGDVVLGINSKKFIDINELNRYLAQFEWGDEVMFSILRHAQKKIIRMKFQYIEK
jgi:S1-C subfamily serine protease